MVFVFVVVFAAAVIMRIIITAAVFVVVVFRAVLIMLSIIKTAVVMVMVFVFLKVYVKIYAGYSVFCGALYH